MNYELFEEKSTTAPRIDTHEPHEGLELTLDELSYVGGGVVHKYDFDV
jgi:hypothetical protein